MLVRKLFEFRYTSFIPSTPCPEKKYHYILASDFAKYWTIFKILVSNRDKKVFYVRYLRYAVHVGLLVWKINLNMCTCACVCEWVYDAPWYCFSHHPTRNAVKGAVRLLIVFRCQRNQPTTTGCVCVTLAPLAMNCNTSNYGRQRAAFTALVRFDE